MFFVLCGMIRQSPIHDLCACCIRTIFHGWMCCYCSSTPHNAPTLHALHPNVQHDISIVLSFAAALVPGNQFINDNAWVLDAMSDQLHRRSVSLAPDFCQGFDISHPRHARVENDTVPCIAQHRAPWLRMIILSVVDYSLLLFLSLQTHKISSPNSVLLCLFRLHNPPLFVIF